MRRREFIAGLGSAAAWSVATRAQQPERMRRIGVLMGSDENDPVWKAGLPAFTQALADLGWTDGRSVRMDLRSGGGDINRIRSLAEELVGSHPDIILTNGTPATVAVQRQTRTTPIVFVNVSDPVASGIVTRLDRPNGNVTGFAVCSRRSPPGSSGPPTCSIPTSFPLLCPRLRQRPSHSRRADQCARS
jgi:putative tryptophan/tyrosine transport system substrate-binding protein